MDSNDESTTINNKRKRPSKDDDEFQMATNNHDDDEDFELNQIGNRKVIFLASWKNLNFSISLNILILKFK